MKPELTPEQKAHKELEAARTLRAQIFDLAQGDPEFIRDTLEGEVDFESIIRSLLASMGETAAHMEGIKLYMADMNERKARLAKRSESQRALIQLALEIAERSKITLDLATVSLTPVQPKAIIQNEADIPAKYWKPQPPALDLKALTDALKDKQEIPGATLSNGGQTVTIRRK
jgi:hypothetical protein